VRGGIIFHVALRQEKPEEAPQRRNMARDCARRQPLLSERQEQTRDLPAADLLECAGPSVLEVAGYPAKIPRIRRQAVLSQSPLDREIPQVFLDQLLHGQLSAVSY
jgi:hypothetical protein